MLPRWRDFATTASLGELDKEAKEHYGRPEWLDSLAEKQSDWVENHTPWHAADFLAASFVLGHPQLAVDAAKLLASQRELPVPLLELARKILENRSEHVVVPEVNYLEGELLHREIHRLKSRASEEPRNAILWVDLARAYTLAGQGELARRQMRVACSLSPDNRFVLRSAARLLVHQGDALGAHRILTRSTATRHDPWLMAAEVGVASSAGIGSMSAKPAKSLIYSGTHPALSLTELASALGSLELESGKISRARKLFRQSLESPTENSLAQVEWASELIPSFQVNVDDFDVPRKFEAEAWQSLSGGDWDKAMDAALCWLQDQPFSSRPAMLASYISSSLLEKYERSIRLLKAALVKNVGHPGIINNLAFALAKAARVDEAQTLLSSLDISTLENGNRITVRATQGLVMFRKGEPNAGRLLYEEAITRARDCSLQKYLALACIHLAREELAAQSPEAVGAVYRAIDEGAKCKEKDVVLLLTRMADEAEDLAARRTLGESRG